MFSVVRRICAQKDSTQNKSRMGNEGMPAVIPNTPDWSWICIEVGNSLHRLTQTSLIGTSAMQTTWVQLQTKNTEVARNVDKNARVNVRSHGRQEKDSRCHGLSLQMSSS